jgi:hypothetical protein
MRVAFNPRALLITVPFALLLWSATDLRSTMALAMAVVVYDVLSFAGVFGTGRR